MRTFAIRSLAHFLLVSTDNVSTPERFLALEWGLPIEEEELFVLNRCP
jgi:hypothetical protein